jgi:hypothetical protein
MQVGVATQAGSGDEIGYHHHQSGSIARDSALVDIMISFTLQ